MGYRNGPGDAEQQELPAQDSGLCAPTHQHETEHIPLQCPEHFLHSDGKLTPSTDRASDTQLPFLWASVVIVASSFYDHTRSHHVHGSACF